MNEKKDYSNFYLTMLIFSLLTNYLFFISNERFFPNEVSIPNSDMVSNYCKNLGYEYGWVSQSCGINEVNCNKKVLGLTNNTCVKWGGRSKMSEGGE